MINIPNTTKITLKLKQFHYFAKENKKTYITYII